MEINNKRKEQKKELIYWKNQAIPEKGKQFIDPLFPPNKNSLLGLDSNGEPIDPIAYKNIPVKYKPYK